MKYAGIIVDISHEKLDRTFQYSIPEELEDVIEIGSCVNMPFGLGNKVRTGYVVEITDTPEIDVSRIKPIIGLAPKSVSINERFIKLAYWMKTNYGSTIFKSLQTVVPVKEIIREEKRKTISLTASDEVVTELMEDCRKHRRAAQLRILEALMENRVSEYGLLKDKLNVTAASIKALESRDVIKIEEYTVFRNAIKAKSSNYKPVVLNSDQQRVADDIKRDFDNGVMDTCLIKGVTGSGKTEVYMDVIEHVLKQGREVIMLIPEISLTYQTVMRFYNRFGDIVSIINSRLSRGEKYDSFNLASQGKIKIMIGPRSALFTPFNNLGLIIIDEEHENAYQSEQVPRYHARETAVELARLTGAKVILGSATPSLESFYRATNGIYKLYRLDNRAGNAKLPTTEIIDLCGELKSGNKRMLSQRLQELIADRLEKKEQIMLFLNRRGLQGMVSCRDCGKVIECPHCAVSMTQHRNGKLICHYCGYETMMVSTCPSCHGTHIGTFKGGTQKVEEDVNALFPEARVLRMDFDTTRGKDGHTKILEQFADFKADILIGTQMIAKGHDFGNVTLVGVINADTSLHSPDFRAAENTFDLLTQVAGRAGRADKDGSVVIQTFDTDNYCIQHAAKHDYDKFYEQEMVFRELMNYPPAYCMMTVRVASANEQLVIYLSDYIKKRTRVADDLWVVGPAEAPVYKVNDIYQKLIYFKSKDSAVLIQIKDNVEAYLARNAERYRDGQVQFDFR